MTVQMDRLPPMSKVLGAIDDEGRATARAAGNLGLAAVRRTLPARSGRLRRGQRLRVGRTGEGYVLEVKPTSRVRYPNGVSAVQVARWVDQGTGVRGPRHRPIKPRKGHAFRLPTGFVSGELQGQAPQHSYQRARTSVEAQVQRELQAGAHRAARAAERALGSR